MKREPPGRQRTQVTSRKPAQPNTRELGLHMEVLVVGGDAAEHATPLLALGLLEGEAELDDAVRHLDGLLGGGVADVHRRGDFRGEPAETLLLYPRADSSPAERLLLLGLGKRACLSAEVLRRAAGAAVSRARQLRLNEVALLWPAREALTVQGLSETEAAQALVEGAVLAGYQFEELKSTAEDEPPVVPVQRFTLVVPEGVAQDAAREGARIGEVVARAENVARTLGNLPGNLATPSFLAETAQRIARERGMECTVLGPAELRAEGMEALLAVSAGSAQEPRLIVLHHRGAKRGEQPLVLVGKGLTFDAGGISIKPAAGMEEMKFDMCGGAATLAAMQAIAELAVPLNVVGVVPSSENLLSGAAVKPGDVINTHLGKTVEVVNTDAEGRLILADALSYLRRFDPAAVLDAATLTGACVIALGHHASAVMSNDEALLAEVRAAGDRVGQRVWPLPMFEEYNEQLKSDYADVKNVGGRPAGSITAGWFLRRFVGDFAWAHLDIAGTAYGDGKLPYQRKGATGVPTRLFVEWVRSRARTAAA